MSAATQTYSRRVSDNPNDALISVEKDEQDHSFPFYVDGTGAQHPPRFQWYEDAVAYVNEYCDGEAV
jgi:hypothetical protein